MIASPAPARATTSISRTEHVGQPGVVARLEQPAHRPEVHAVDHDLRRARSASSGARASSCR
jgi:hypothetical protein